MTSIELFTFLASLFSMMNPIGGLGVFARMTTNMTAREARATAWKCVVAAAITLLIVTWTGGIILQLFGINVNEIRVAGGIIVFLIGLHMMFDKHEHNSARQMTEAPSIAIVPLAIPLLSGPGTMATVLVTAQHHAGIISRIELSVVILFVCFITGVLFHFAQSLAKKIGDNGMGVVSQIMGLVLMAISVGMLSSGLQGIFPALKGM